MCSFPPAFVSETNVIKFHKDNFKQKHIKTNIHTIHNTEHICFCLSTERNSTVAFVLGGFVVLPLVISLEPELLNNYFLLPWQNKFSVFCCCCSNQEYFQTLNQRKNGKNNFENEDPFIIVGRS